MSDAFDPDATGESEDGLEAGYYPWDADPAPDDPDALSAEASGEAGPRQRHDAFNEARKTEYLKALAKTGAVAAEGRHLGIGARLTRNWKGREVEVVVEEQGFRWQDRHYPSLSAAATAIAGTRWNGPRFFGLRDAA